MKLIYLYTIGIFIMFMSPSSYLCAQGVAENNQFFDWKESDYKAYEDSLLKALYPPVIAKTAENPERFSQQPQAFVPKAISDNTYVPTTVTIDKSKAVGEIPIQTGVSPTGAKTYTVPIQVYPGINGFEPQLSLAYNSQQGNGIVGIGWGIGGVQSIMRTSRNIYYDGKPQGALRTKADAFVLDGMRLIKISENATTINYESEQGNIKVKAFLSGDVVKYFEVFYPNGTKGIFGYASNTSNKIFYPIVSLSDLRNNQILYTYVEQENHYRLTKVAYNGASVEFQYQASRPDPLVSFIGGLKTGESYLLAKIISKLGSTALCTYSLSYKNQNNSSVLSQIDYSASGQSLNPIKLYYGEGITDGSYDNGSVTQLYNWYESTDPARIKVVKGRYDYASGADGLISLPNENPYWEHYRHSTAFQHSQNRYDNKFTGEEKIYLYAGLNSEYASPMPNLTTGANFIDIFCADLEGKQEEHIIKVNNGVSGDNDQVTFRVYRASLTVGLVSKYTRTFNFPTVLTDADGAKSIHPKFYYTGDFNGDGKQEVLAVSCHHPFGETSKTSKCYIFDLESGKVLYQSYLFPYNVNFVGTEQPDPEDAFQKTDRLLVLDYDGDGKSDIALINDSGVNIYTFDVSGSTWTGRKVSTYTGLKKVDLKDRSLLLGEINGDGLMDLLVSPKKKDPVYTWAAYNSMGDGQFYKSTFAGTQNSGISTDGFLLQDVNGDGMTDLIRYHSSGFFTYLAKKNNVGSVECAQNYTSKSILIPTNINSHNYFSQLVSLKNGVVTKYSFKRNDNKGVLATGMANSLGVVEKNTYLLMNEEAMSSGTYAKGANAVFPYVDIQESIPVIAFSSTYMKGNRVDNFTFTYRGGVIHRQGLGFRGFESIFRTNLKGQLTEQYFDPYKYGILKSEVSPEAKSTYNFAVNVQANKTVKIRLSNKTEQDLLKGITATTAFVYDTYGNATQETITYTGGITVKKANTFYNNTAESGYLIGFLTDQSVTTTRNSSTYTERMNIPSHTNGYANSKVFYKNGNKAKTYEYVYDTPGNITKETLFLYGSDKGLKTEYAYDTNGRLKKVTNPLGLANEFSYNTEGRMSSEKDHRGKSTAHTYDPFGRETSVTFPDNTTATVSYGWSEEGTNALYAITRSVTGKPTTKSVYDALNREVRTAETRFNGSFLKTDKIYDSYGRVQKVSRPFAGSSATAWNIYSYDTYDRLTAISEPSGRKTTHGYSGNSITTVEDGISVKRTYDALGNLISVVDPAGTITYNLRPDGQPSSIVAPGNVTTSFGYDGFGRRTSLGDPSSGTTTYAYDASGNLLKETNANNKVINYTYDTYNRLKTATLPEFTTTYTYNGYDELTKVSSSVGTSIDYVYDALGRLSSQTETAVDNKYLRKDYTYNGGNVSSIKYTSQSGVLTTENYNYANGHLVETKLNNQTSIFKLTKENDMGLPTEVRSGALSRTYGYDSYGFPTSRKIQKTGVTTFLQNMEYVFDPVKRNLTYRKDINVSQEEKFSYDNLNRLTSYKGLMATYDAKGNILTKGDVSGTFAYNTSGKPYAISSSSVANGIMSSATQVISYTSFKRPNAITQDGNVASFTYNGNQQRVKMQVAKGGSRLLTRYYLGDCYEIDETPSGNKEKLYLAGENYYDASAVLVKDHTNSWKLYYIGRDYLGSITDIITEAGTKYASYNFDAWGRQRNSSSHVYIPSGQEVELFLGRGYSGHEHLKEFGLVNMNARLYDPALGRFLAPDPFVQMPDLSQNFNRYSYAMNNPLRYVDEDGEFIHIIIGAVIGGTANLIYKAVSGQLHSFKDGFAAFGIGAAAGGLGAATGGLAFAAAGGAAGGIGGFLAGAAAGSASTAVMMPVQSAGNSLYFGDQFMSLKDYGLGILGGALTGGIGNGMVAALKGNNFWTGKDVKFGRTIFSFKNTATRPAPEMRLMEASTPSVNVERPNLTATGDKISVANDHNTYTVYQGVDANGDVRYIGITSRKPEVRFSEHLNSGTNRATLDYRPIQGTGNLNKLDARIMEQKLINRYGMQKNGGSLYNLRNEIKPKFWDKHGIGKY